MSAPAAFGPLISGDWLLRHAPEVCIVDVRWYLDGRSGAEEFAAGHIPGAVWLDVDSELSGPATAADGRHPLPTPEVFASALGRAGIATGRPVVAYDDAGGSIAARLWWLLHVLGERVAVLDGGLAAWPGELTSEVGEPSAVRREPRDWPPDRFADADAVAAHDGPLIDARAVSRYTTGDLAIDPRPGHIPGAINLPWAGNLDEMTGRFLPPQVLRQRFAALNVTDNAGTVRDARVVAYCGSGITACHNLLALELAGTSGTALYPGSWSQWGADLFRPTETGAPAAEPAPSRG
ncbi:MAG: sulfurtransferase [Actinomycetota bacterium]|nr:sulfurtransferase [Actinomycetota bacterium]